MNRMVIKVVVLCILATMSTNTWAGSEGGLSGVINLNQATVEQLILLPGVGEVRAREIIEARKIRPFTSQADVLEIKGVGERLVALWGPHLVYEGKTTLMAGVEK